MAKKQKYYAVKKGNEVGVFRTWEECQKATKGFSGPEYKAFITEEEAVAYMNDEDIILRDYITPLLKEDKVVAFVDGSFDAKKRVYGYGAYILAPDSSKPVELCGKGNNDKHVDLRNIAGEILSVINAVDWVWKNGYHKVVIFHDYEGISKWANGEWEASKSLSRFYQAFIEEKRELLEIDFIKVSGHSNNAYNDKADALAKSAIAENKVMRDQGGNGGFIISNVKEDDILEMLGKLKDESKGFEYNVIDHGNRKVYYIQFGKEKVTLQHYNNIKMMVQGKRSNLFQMVTTGIIENISCGDFIKILREAYEISIDNKKVESDFKKEMPAISSVILPDNVLKLLKQATIDLSNPAYGDIEFSKYTFSALKALEGVLKYNLCKCKIAMKSTSFTMFDKALYGIYKLQEAHSKLLSNDEVEKLENCYNHLYNNRHTLFHFGVIIGEIDVNTRMLNTKKEANDIIKSTLKVIDTNYIE